MGGALVHQRGRGEQEYMYAYIYAAIRDTVAGMEYAHRTNCTEPRMPKRVSAVCRMHCWTMLGIYIYVYVYMYIFIST